MIALSQSWEQPVTIYSGGYNTSPDFFIDRKGTIHCVWEHRIGVNYTKIYYSRSTDYGSTWSEIQDISMNSSLWVSDPHIISDSSNNLFVSYDYKTGSPNNMLVLIKKFDGTQWSEPDTISTDMPGSMHNRLLIDHNNKIYCFWHNGIQGGKIFYRTLMKNVGWSEIYQPFSGNNDLYFLQRAVPDHNNNLHCAGVHHYEGQNGYDNRTIYFSYTNGIWSDFIELSNNTTTGGLDISLDSNSLPSLTWGQYTTDTIPPNHGTFVTSFNGTNWSTPLLLVEDTPSEQAIAIDRNNNLYIVDNEKKESGYQQVCYKKTSGSWASEIVDQDNYGYFNHKLILNNNELFISYSKVDTILPTSMWPLTSIQMRRYDTNPGIQKNNNYDYGLSINPNPFKDKIKISFRTNCMKLIQIKIFNQTGQLIKTILNENKAIGDYSIFWEGDDVNGKEVSTGQYLLHFKSGNIENTQVIIKNQ